MRNAKAWLWGLIPLVVIWVLANAVTGPMIKADLTARTDDMMARQGQPWARAQIFGRDARIVSPAPSPGAKVSALAAAVDTYGVRSVSGEGEVLPPRSPFTFSAERASNALTLKGYAPDDATRNGILAAAGRAVPGAAITSQIELADGAPKDFAAATAYALQQLSRLAEGDASLSNTTLSISGRAASREGYNAFVGALKGVPQGFTMSSANVIPPRVSPFVFKASRANGNVTLEGFVPDEAARNQIVAALARLLPNAAVTSRLEVADGAPQNFTALAGFALEQLSRVAPGSVSLSGTALTVEGQAATIAGYAALTETLKALPQGMTLAASTVTPAAMSPYEWSAAKSGNGVTLRGAVPDAARRDANLAAARALGGAVSDEQVIASGAPADYAQTAAAAIAALSKLDEGAATLRDRALSVSGRAASPAVRADVLKSLSALSGVSVANTVTAPAEMPPPVEPAPLSSDLIAPPPPPPAPVVQAPPPPPPPPPPPVVQAPPPPPPPPAPAEVIVRTPQPASAPAQSCKERVMSAVDGRRVLFARSRAEIDTESNDLIRGIAAALKDCGSIDISIEGHADGDGQSANNQRLSEARAAAVLDALKAAGAGGARLASSGYGFTKPLVANDTKDNKAKNRRVEFIIR